MALGIQGRDADALDHAQRGLALFTAVGDRPGRALALNGVGWFYALLGDHRQALGYCGQALELYQELGSYPQMEAGTWDSLGYAHQQLSDHAEAAACYQQALDLFRQAGDSLGMAETLGHIGDARLAAGQPEEARAAWQEALTILDDLHHPGFSQVRAKLAELGPDPGT